MVPHIADDAMPTFEDVCSGLGQKLNGTLCRRGVFHHTALVPMPRNMAFEEAATLTCSGLTAWNALMGMPGREVMKGDWVLVQGTGGVSVAALQVSWPWRVAGCRVYEMLMLFLRSRLQQVPTSSPSRALSPR